MDEVRAGIREETRGEHVEGIGKVRGMRGGQRQGRRGEVEERAKRRDAVASCAPRATGCFAGLWRTLNGFLSHPCCATCNEERTARRPMIGAERRGGGRPTKKKVAGELGRFEKRR